jgi:acyl-CoA synthetase (AMP-forming)/AMP-acid ligase II
MIDYQLLQWLEHPQINRGIRLAGHGDEWSFHSYARLAAQARYYSWQMRNAGLRPGDVSALVHGNSPDFIAAFFGCLMAGGTPAPLAPPARFQDRPSYVDHVSRLLRLARPRLVSTTTRWAGLLGPVAEQAGGRIVLPGAESGTPEPVKQAPPPPEIGLLQFTSGSTGPARAVQVPLSALDANLDIIEQWTEGTAEQATATWAPLHHDMGLIGCVLTPVSRGADIWLMDPEHFLRAPLRWLRCFGESGASFTAMPNFGLRHVVDRVKPEDLQGMDFRSWRALVVGAERVDSAAIEDFVRLLEPFGFTRHAVMPSYGLAEATLAVAGSRLDEAVTTIVVEPATLASGAQVKLAARRGDHINLVGCGRPFRGVGVTIVDESDRPLPAGSIGEIKVSGRCVARGCLGPGENEFRRFNGVVRTGDAGFVLDGQLYVLGRIGDTVKLKGRWLFAEHLDEVIRHLMPQHCRYATLLGPVHGRDTAIVLVEGDLSSQAMQVGTALARHTDGLRVVVFLVRRGSILRTTSGKPRRRPMWQRFAAGQMAGFVGWDSEPGSLPARTETMCHQYEPAPNQAADGGSGRRCETGHPRKEGS